MQSHTYEFHPKDLARLAGPPLIVLVAFAVLVQVGVLLGLLPAKRPTLDTDRTILVHQAEAARAPQQAGLVLIGDSSCLMDVAARDLSQALGRPVLDLGTLSYLDLNAYASILGEYARANPNRLRTVVLLMHPEALRRPSPESYYVDLLHTLLSSSQPSTINHQPSTLLGFTDFRERCLTRLLPIPLGGAFGHRYGFTKDLENYLTFNCGSLAEPDTRPFAGNAEYRLAPSLEKASHAFRSALPLGCDLLVAITPAPEHFVRKDYLQTHAAMLAQWTQWLAPATPLTNLPPTLPARDFASTTHLTPEGAKGYTKFLSAALAGASR